MSTAMSSGYFSRLGSIHLHIDGVGKDNAVQSILKQLDMEKLPWKISAITDAILGPQVNKYPAEYDSHNPISFLDGRLDYFATIDISRGLDLVHPSTNVINEARERTIHQLKEFLPRLVRCHGVVVEVERIIGKVDYDGQWQEAPPEAVIPLLPQEISFPAALTLPVEIHHAFDIPKTADMIPIALEDLMGDCNRLGMLIGGWFIFQSHDQWRYRSNLFLQDLSSFSLVAQQQDNALRQHLQVYGFHFTQKTVVERILGIWKFN